MGIRSWKGGTGARRSVRGEGSFIDFLSRRTCCELDQSARRELNRGDAKCLINVAFLTLISFSFFFFSRFFFPLFFFSSEIVQRLVTSRRPRPLRFLSGRLDYERVWLSNVNCLARVTSTISPDDISDAFFCIIDRRSDRSGASSVAIIFLSWGSEISLNGNARL